MSSAAFAGLAVAGTGVNIYGQIKAAQEQADAARANAAIKNAQADELLSRETSNEALMQEQGDLMTKRIENAGAGQGSPTAGGVLRFKKSLEYNLANSQRDAAFKAQMLRAGATIDTNLASDYMTGAYIKSFGTLLGTGAQFYSVDKKSNTPGDLMDTQSGYAYSQVPYSQTGGYNPDAPGNYNYTRGY